MNDLYECEGLSCSIDINHGNAWIKELSPTPNCPPELYIPSSIVVEGRNYPVIGISENAFGWHPFRRVDIPEGVQVIEACAFYQCHFLKEISLPEGLLYIGNLAFDSCMGLKSITIPSSVTFVASNAFFNCTQLAHVSSPAPENIGGGEFFKHCPALESVEITGSASCIRKGTFEGCKNLRTIILDDENTIIEDDACDHLVEVTSTPRRKRAFRL